MSGVYGKNGNFVSWQDLLNMKMRLEKDYDYRSASSEAYDISQTNIRQVWKNNNLSGELIIDDSVRTLGQWAICDVDNLTGITLGANTNINPKTSGIGQGCKDLQFINISPNNNMFSTVNGVLYTKDKKTIITYPAAKEGTTFNIPSTVTEIYVLAFWNNKNLVQLNIPDSVKTITAAAAYGSNLQVVTIGSGVLKIEEESFTECRNLRTINYRGTKAQWNAISKSNNWKRNTPSITIHCIDGNLIEY